MVVRRTGTRPQGRLRALALMAMLVTVPWTGAASVVVPMTLGELTEAAAVIVDGTVAEVRTVVGPSGAERLVLLHVSAAWKGQADATLYVRLAGGRLGRTETVVPGVPVVGPGDRLVWFLQPHPRGGYLVTGLHQGALRLQTASDGEVVVAAPMRAASSRGDVRRRPRRLAEVTAEVRALIAGVTP